MANTSQLYEIYKNYPVICTDTRSITKDCLFFALKGENFNANKFAETALMQGAKFAIVDEAAYVVNGNYILVDDVLVALQELAKYYRAQLNIPIIGLTGSNGKTTTKELIRAILAEKFSTFATKGNLNNHIGVPLSILSIQPNTEIAVIEMGANHQKEIEFLCEISQPTHGLITNVGLAHLDGFGGFEGVKKGKGELYTYLKQSAGVAFINQDNQHLMQMAASADLTKVVCYGTENKNSISGKLKHSDPFIEFEWTTQEGTYQAKANLTGTYNFENILAAICIGHFFDLTPAQINNGLENYFPNNNRSQLTKTESNTVICDFYNANPTSMIAALSNLKTLSSTNKTAIIGDMFELGEEASEQHKAVAKMASEIGVDNLILIGKNFYAYKEDFTATFFENPVDAKAYLEKNLIKDSLVLLKGSRGMALEQLLPLL